jgi:hypothetical protein
MMIARDRRKECEDDGGALDGGAVVAVVTASEVYSGGWLRQGMPGASTAMWSPRGRDGVG